MVVLIDEYDYPILSALDTPIIAEENRKVLKNFFSVLKSLDGYMRAIFVTGVTKFSKTSIFSGLNNLNDLTMDKAAATLLGYTEEEIIHFFSPYIEIIAQERNQTFENILQEMKYWYNGYRFSAKEIKVYNPYSVLNYLFEKEQHNYWLETGTPTFLIPLLRKQYRSLDNLKTVELSSEALGTVEVADIPAITLLYQTGYLTISAYDEKAKLYTLDFPNAEVKDTFNKYLFMSLSQTNLPTIESTISQLKHALNDTNIPLFCTILQSLFAHIPYSLDAKDEQFYHKFFQLLCNLFAIDAQSEVLTDKGRIDMVATTATHIFIFEFKLHADAQAALTQIEEKRYYEKYLLSNKKVGLVGISFALENKKPQLECAYKEIQSPLQKKVKHYIAHSSFKTSDNLEKKNTLSGTEHYHSIPENNLLRYELCCLYTPHILIRYKQLRKPKICIITRIDCSCRFITPSLNVWPREKRTVWSIIVRILCIIRHQHRLTERT